MALLARISNFVRNPETTPIFSATILGEPASKSNSRQLVTFKTKGGGKRPAFIKSAKARAYVEAFGFQVRRPPVPLEGELIMSCRIFYASNRPDLDPSLVLDCLQKFGVIKNDRQIREQHLYHEIDKVNPRVELQLFYRFSESLF